MTKVLFIGDVHIKFNNLADIAVLEDVISRQVCDLIVVAGDVLDSFERLNTQLLNIAYAFIATCRRIAPVYLLVGNHDYINNQQFLSQHHWMNGLKEWTDVTVIDRPVLSSDLNFLFMPYVPPGRFHEALSTIKDFDNLKSLSCIFAHQEMRNCKMGCITSQVGDEWPLDYPLIISGHIHERQSPQPNILYPGSVISHSFAHDNQGLSLFIFDEGGLVEKRIQLGLVRKQIIRTDVKSLSSCDRHTVQKNIKFSVKDSLANIVAFKKSIQYKSLLETGAHVVFQPVTALPIKESHDQSFQSFQSFQSILSGLVKKESDVELEKDLLFVLA